MAPFCVCVLLRKLDLGQEGSPYITLFSTPLQAFSQTRTSKTGHPEGMFAHKVIRDQVNFPCISSKNGRP